MGILDSQSGALSDSDRTIFKTDAFEQNPESMQVAASIKAGIEQARQQ